MAMSIAIRATIQHSLEPEEYLVIAVYIRALEDLLYGRSDKMRKEAEEFFRSDGFNVEEIKQVWQKCD
jgi:hypothetical protein